MALTLTLNGRPVAVGQASMSIDGRLYCQVETAVNFVPQTFTLRTYSRRKQRQIDVREGLSARRINRRRGLRA